MVFRFSEYIAILSPILGILSKSSNSSKDILIMVNVYIFSKDQIKCDFLE